MLKLIESRGPAWCAAVMILFEGVQLKNEH